MMNNFNLLAEEPGIIGNPALGPNLQGKTGADFFHEVLPRFVAIGLVIGVIIFFFILIIGAIQWIASGGDKNAIEGARSKITNAIVGLIILLSIFAFIRIIESFFGVKILTLDIGPLML